MSNSRSVRAAVEVPIDPVTAFTVFTEEIDCWWVQGPINFYDSSRAYRKRIEPGVDGRVVEVYDDGTGEGLEIARITAWEPGVRLAWRSSIDDVMTDIRFDKSGAGTVVSVEATIPAQGVDRGGTSWVRVTPTWFGSWVSKRDGVHHVPIRLSRLAVAIHYREPARGARWLRDVFGLEPAGPIPDHDRDDGLLWIEFHVGNSSLIVLRRKGDTRAPAPASPTPWVFVDDLDSHFGRTRAGGAEIVSEIRQHGVRTYDVDDLEGHRWTFAQASPTMRGPDCA
ncbi:MAG TPA: hypothetical protein VG032_11180 [Acidimicrobiales bacterium]|nr:hypothetical protein [Acidimicrobiales bacterium]